jgi:hypothetical protein
MQIFIIQFLVSEKHPFLYAYKSCCTSINPTMIGINDQVNFRNNNSEIHFWYIICVVINF